MRKVLVAVAVIYSLIGLLYVNGDWRAASSQSVVAGETRAMRCPPPEIAPTCGRPDMYPTVAP